MYLGAFASARNQWPESGMRLPSPVLACGGRGEVGPASIVFGTGRDTRLVFAFRARARP
jgi:hypothetical protein